MIFKQRISIEIITRVFEIFYMHFCYTEITKLQQINGVQTNK